MANNHSRYRVIRVTPTLDTSAYADGDILFDATEIPDAVLGNGGCSKLVSVAITNKQGDVTPMTMYFQQTARGMGVANNAMDVSSANTGHAKQLGYIEAPTNSWKDMGSTCLFNAKTDENVSSLPLMLQAKEDSTSVYFFASVGGAETFAASDLTFVFGIEV
jgi:hypothetical protein